MASSDNLVMSEKELGSFIDALAILHPEHPRAAIALYVHTVYDTIVGIPLASKAMAGPRMGALKLWGEMLGVSRALRSGTSSETGEGKSTFGFRVEEIAEKALQYPPKP